MNNMQNALAYFDMPSFKRIMENIPLAYVDRARKFDTYYLGYVEKCVVNDIHDGEYGKHAKRAFGLYTWLFQEGIPLHSGQEELRKRGVELASGIITHYDQFDRVERKEKVTPNMLGAELAMLSIYIRSFFSCEDRSSHPNFEDFAKAYIKENTSKFSRVLQQLNEKYA